LNIHSSEEICSKLNESSSKFKELLSIESFTERAKQLAKKDLINMSFNGVALKLETIHTNKGIADVLFD